MEGPVIIIAIIMPLVCLLFILTRLRHILISRHFSNDVILDICILQCSLSPLVFPLLFSL
jgi:hypothetical protein